MNKADTTVVAAQLKPRTMLAAETACRCPYGMPSVILLSPVAEDGITPVYMAISTPLWLTCPYLNKRIHDLESAGWLCRLKEELKSGGAFAEKMEKAIHSYYELRKKLFAEKGKNIEALAHIKARLNSGIGGIRGIKMEEMFSLKCLHLHAAHYAFCGDNPAGQAVFRLLGNDICCSSKICGARPE